MDMIRANGLLEDWFHVIQSYNQLMAKGKQGADFFDKYVSLQVLEFMQKANEERNSYEAAIGFIDRYIDKVIATEKVNPEK